MIGTVSGPLPLNRSMILNRKLVYILFLVIFFSVKNLLGQGLFDFDESRSSVIRQSTASNIGIADINNDGINDIVVSGFDNLNQEGLFLDIYSVTNEGLIDTFQLDIVDNLFSYNNGISEYIGGNGGLDIGDFDIDGMADILLHGSENLFLSKNLGNSVSINNYLPSYVREKLIKSSASWGDVDLDGDLDIFWAGIKVYQNKPYITNKLLLNNGDDFEFETMVMPDLHNGAVAWSDIDLDGDLDLLISGESVNTRSGSTRLYKNDPLGRLAEDTNQEIIALKGTAICFSDLDQDSDPDLIISGWDPIDQNLKTVVYVNEPTGTFRLAEEQINFGTIFGTIEAIDINLDGWKDLAISGGTEHAMAVDSYYDLTNIQTTILGDTLSADTVWYYEYRDSVSALGGKIFLNEGIETIFFNESQTFNGARTISFSDINLDNTPDLICSGTTEIGERDSAFVSVFLNTVEGTNAPPDPPEVLESFAISNRAIFNWGSGSDNIDPDQSLRYNLKIGTSSGSNDLLSSATQFNNPNVGTRLIREFTNIPWGTYYWSVQTIDASGIVSSWSQENELFIPRIVNSTQSLPGYSFGVSRWSDINDDELLDIAISGNLFSGSSLTQIFMNEDGLLEPSIHSGSIKNTYGGHISFADYTNDGNLDISLSGFHTSDWNDTYPATFFYKLTDNGYAWDEQPGLQYYAAGYQAGYLGGYNNHDWGDYDNDGDLDLLMNGELDNKDLITKVYENLEAINNANVGPSRPVMLLDSVNVDTVRLSWNNSVDLENSLGAGKTPALGIRYQLQLGGDQNYNLYANTHSIISGKYGTGRMGTLAKNSRLIQSIPEGRYQWRVRAVDHGLGVSEWSDWDYFYIDQTAPVVETIQANYGVGGQIILVVRFEEEFEMDNNTPSADPYVYATHPDTDDIDEDGVSDTLLAIKQSYNAEVWTGLLSLPETYVGKAIKLHVSNVADMRGNTMVSAAFFKTPEKIISQAGGTVISSDGNVSVLFPQNAVSEDVSVSINLLNTESALDSNSISNYYTITPSDIQLNKPTILRIAISSQYADLTENNYNPHIGHINTSTGAISPLGGSIINVNSIPYIQTQLSKLGVYAAFRSDSTITLDSLDTEKIICQPRIFSPAGSVFEFPHTNILFDLAGADNVTARIFNLSGKIKRTLKPEQKLGPGNNIIVWDGKDSGGSVVPSGLYIVTLESSGSMLKTTVGVLNR